MDGLWMDEQSATWRAVVGVAGLIVLLLVVGGLGALVLTVW